MQLRETTIKLSGKDERINELRHEIESLRREFDLVNQGNQQLRVRVHELESNVNCYDSVANKSSITITSLQKEAKEKQEQLIDLQARMRSVHRDLSLSPSTSVSSLELTWKNARRAKEKPKVFTRNFKKCSPD